MERSKLGGQWNVPNLVTNGMFQCLVANGMSQASWAMECSKLCGQWNVPMFGGQWNVPLFGGQWKVKEKTPFHFFPLSPQQTLFQPLFFSFDLKVLL